MRLLLSVILLALFFTGCAELMALQNEQNSRQNGSDTNATSDSSKPEGAYDSFNKSSRKSDTNYDRRENMVHILRQANGTTIEFWIDLYNDDVKIDYEFDDKTGINEKVELLPTKYTAITNDTKSEETPKKVAPQANADVLQLYLASYEKAQQLSYEKKYSLALENINKALSISPEIVQGWKLKGSILFMLNDKVGAKKAWQQALSLDPYAKDVQKSLAELERK